MLAGIEVDIRADGMDMDDEALATRDWVMASIHSGFDGSRERLTERAGSGDAAPARRLHQARPGGRSPEACYELDFERVCEAAVETGTFWRSTLSPTGSTSPTRSPA